MIHLYNTDSYKKYFEYLATNHQSILHQASSSNIPINDQPKGASRFFAFNREDLLTGFRSQLPHGVCLYLQNYKWKGYDNGAFDYRSIHTGGFIIATNVNMVHGNDTANALSETESIVWDIINRLCADSLLHRDASKVLPPGICPSPFYALSLADFDVEPIGPIWDGRHGWWVEFNFSVKRHREMDTDNTKKPTIWQDFNTNI
jgi:hypothetical protein